ncbi:hepatocyte cell adhesion molecule-like isoform X1 [Carcharodon carcharias]|uniref:hepatocyte cell adhesion molecule-like isoform X1 n=1 Tax=Carcharodon carcharias TaxID=13397 RepID=UPI001B7E459C|nr:hepatocyte cell adhesion molecule-like isoform X1 [Carcharodon carcharias]
MGRTLPPLLLLGLFLLRPLHAEVGRREVFAAIGSSVLLDPEHEANLSNSEIIWNFTGSNGNLVTILDYVPNHPMEEPNNHFKSRLHFNSSTGSLILNHLNPSDQGVYTIILDDKLIRITDLSLIEPLAEPLINVTFVDTTIELTCKVSVGKASSILWRKDAEVIRNGQHYQLVRNNSKLIISEASKSDCGIYTCTVENPVSKKNYSYSLTIYGAALLHRYTKILSITALITAAAALACKIISSWFLAKIISLQFLQLELRALQFIFLIGAFVCWIWGEGASEMTVCTLVFLCLLLIVLLFSSCRMKACDTRLNKIWIVKPCHLILMVAVSPLGGIIVMGLSVSLIAETVKRAAEGCEPAANLQRNIIPAVGILLVSFVILFAHHIIYRKLNKRIAGTPLIAPSVKDPDGLYHSELKGHFLKTTVTNEEQL